jgi:hypothetical protein
MQTQFHVRSIYAKCNDQVVAEMLTPPRIAGLLVTMPREMESC